MFLVSTLMSVYISFFFFNDTATTEIYTLSLHDALPISALAARSPVPVEVDVGRLGGPGAGRLDRPPAAVESTAYFVVAEALANVAKHAAGTRAEVRIAREGEWLVVQVRDDGVGGADPARGSGLAGLADRVAAV